MCVLWILEKMSDLTGNFYKIGIINHLKYQKSYFMIFSVQSLTSSKINNTQQAKIFEKQPSWKVLFQKSSNMFWTPLNWEKKKSFCFFFCKSWAEGLSPFNIIQFTFGDLCKIREMAAIICQFVRTGAFLLSFHAAFI